MGATTTGGIQIPESNSSWSPNIGLCRHIPHILYLDQYSTRSLGVGFSQVQNGQERVIANICCSLQAT